MADGGQPASEHLAREQRMGSDSSVDERWLPILPLSKSSTEVATSWYRRAELIPSGLELPKSVSTAVCSHEGSGADTYAPPGGRACTPHTCEGCVLPGTDGRTTAPRCGDPGTSDQGGCSGGSEVSTCSKMGCASRQGPGYAQQQAMRAWPCYRPIHTATRISSISDPALDTRLRECHLHHAGPPDLRPSRTCKEAETMITCAELRDVGVQTESPNGGDAGWGISVRDGVWDEHAGSLDSTELSQAIQNHLGLWVAEATGSCEADPDGQETPAPTQAGSRRKGKWLKLAACCIRTRTMAD